MTRTREAARTTAHAGGRFELVVVANRLPLDRREDPDGTTSWHPSPGGLVAALEPVMRRQGGAWVGWTGSVGPAPEEFDAIGMHLVPIGMDAGEVNHFYEGMSNGTLWPLYHDVIVPPTFRRAWWEAYVRVNGRFAEAAAAQAGVGGTVWVQDYQLQLVPRMLRRLRPDLMIGFFNHIPFPPYEIFAQLPWRREVLKGLLGACLLGFQRPADVNNFLRACRRMGLPTAAGTVRVDGPPRWGRGRVTPGGRTVRAATFPISIDAQLFEDLARRPQVQARARQIRAELGEPELVLLGVDRLDYTKGILQRLAAFGELLDEGRLTVPGAVLVQVATPSRERVEQYRTMREQVEVAVGRINGTHGTIGHPAVHYLHQSKSREELVALYLAADVMLVTSLRDGMNLVAKEYVAARIDERGALVLSEFTGAANELKQAYVVNPHDIDGLKDAIVAAASAGPREASRRMSALRRRVFEFDVSRWAQDLLDALGRAGGSRNREVLVPAGFGPRTGSRPSAGTGGSGDGSGSRAVAEATFRELRSLRSTDLGHADPLPGAPARDPEAEIALIERISRALMAASGDAEPRMDPAAYQRLRGRLLQKARAQVTQDSDREPA